MTPTGVRGEYVGGVRYKAWAAAVRRCIRPSACMRRWYSTWSIPGTAAPSAAAPTTSPIRADAATKRFPVNANEAEARRVARFMAQGHTHRIRSSFQPESPSRGFPAHPRPAQAAGCRGCLRTFPGIRPATAAMRRQGLTPQGDSLRLDDAGARGYRVGVDFPGAGMNFLRLAAALLLATSFSANATDWVEVGADTEAKYYVDVELHRGGGRKHPRAGKTASTPTS